jgi:hypothetical protein
MYGRPMQQHTWHPIPLTSFVDSLLVPVILFFRNRFAANQPFASQQRTEEPREEVVTQQRAEERREGEPVTLQLESGSGK